MTTNGYIASAARVKIGSILINASDIISADLQRSYGSTEVTGLGDANGVHVTNVAQATFVVNGYWQSGSAASGSSLRQAIEAVTAQADRSDTIIFYPDGSGSGSLTQTFTGVLTDFQGPTASNTEFAACNATFTVSGAITSGSA